MTDNKYAVALTQIVASLQDSKNALSMAQMSVKLMLPGVHKKADTVGMIMVQLSMKASFQKWGPEAEYAITKEAAPLAQLVQAKALAWVNQEAEGADVGISYLCQTEERWND
jgi:hypothetical protein